MVSISMKSVYLSIKATQRQQQIYRHHLADCRDTLAQQLLAYCLQIAIGLNVTSYLRH